MADNLSVITRLRDSGFPWQEQISIVLVKFTAHLALVTSPSSFLRRAAGAQKTLNHLLRREALTCSI